MTTFAFYRFGSESPLQYTPPVAIAAGQPIELSPGFWGVSSLPVPAGTLGDFQTQGFFRCLKSNPAATFAVGDTAYYVPDVGFAVGAGAWRVIKQSVSGEREVELEINAIGGGSGSSATSEVVVTGIGSSSDDSLAIADAVDLLNSWGKGTLVLDGDILAAGPFKFNHGINLRFTPGATFSQSNANQIEATFIWEPDDNWHPLYSPDSAFRPFNAIPQTGPNTIVVPLLAETGIVKGDWFLLIGDDSLNELLTSHAADIDTRPMELHQAQHVVAATNTIYTADLIEDKYTLRPRILKVPLLAGPVIDGAGGFINGTVDQAGWSADTYAQLFRVYGFKNPTVKNLNVGRLGPGAIGFGYCANVVIRDCHYEGVAAIDHVYAMTGVCCNGFSVRGCTVEGTRHAVTVAGDVMAATQRKASANTPLTFTAVAATDVFTTQRAHELENGDILRVYNRSNDANLDTTQLVPYYVKNKTSTTFQLSPDADLVATFDVTADITTPGQFMYVRAGSPLNTVVDGNIFHGPTKVTDAGTTSRRDILSCHPESIGTIFRNNLITLGQPDVGARGGSGIVIRGRRNQAIGNTIRGSVGTLNSNNADDRGLQILGPDTVVKGNVIEDVTYGLLFNAQSWDTVGAGVRCLAENNTFRRVNYTVVHLDGSNAPLAAGGIGADLRFLNNALHGCAGFNGNNGDLFQIRTTNHTGGAVVSVDTGTSTITLTTAHGLAAAVPVLLVTTGTLPGGLSLGTPYYVLSPSGATLKLSLTPNGPAVPITDGGSGTHNLLSCAPPAKGTRFCGNYIEKPTGATGIDLFNLTEALHAALISSDLAFVANVFDGWGSSITASDVLGTNGSSIASAWTAKNEFI